MRSLKRLLLPIAILAIGTTSLLSTRPSEAAIEDVQRTSWGLETFGQSRSVARFSALGWAVEEVGGTVFAGGNFLDVTNGVRTERQPYLAAFSVNTGRWQEGFTPEVGGPVLALEPAPDGGLFVGGEMDEWNGRTIGALAKIDPVTGTLWPGWNTRLYGGTSVVRDLSLGPDGWLYAAGTFTTASDSGNPRTVNSVVRLDPSSGDIDWSWLPETEGGGLWGVSASYTQPTVYLAGWGNVMAGEQVVGVDSTNANQLTWTGFSMNYSCCSLMYDIQATPFGTVFAVGEQHGAYLYDEADNMKQIIGHVTSYDSRYQNSRTRRGGDYQDIELIGDRLFATCHCWGSHSTGDGFTPAYNSNLARVSGVHTGLVSGVIAYDARTGVRDQSFNPYLAGDVGGWGVLEASDGCLWIAGGFNAVGPPGSQAPGRDLARLCDENFTPAGDVDPPGSCLATFTGDAVAVTWDQVVGVADYVVYRSINGGNQSWRGRTTAASFTDTNRDAALVYYVAARDDAQVRTESTECTSEIDDAPVQPFDPPTNCVATIGGAVVAVAWDPGAGAVEYIVYRSVDGGNQYWRGRTAGTTFVDTDRAGSLTYYVLAKSAELERSERTECTTVDGPPPQPVEIEPVASCTVTDGAAVDDVTINWPSIGDPDALYIIYRSINGGNPFWRGRTADSTFADRLRSGEIEYAVDVKVGNERSQRTICEPVVQGN